MKQETGLDKTMKEVDSKWNSLKDTPFEFSKKETTKCLSKIR